MTYVSAADVAAIPEKGVPAGVPDAVKFAVVFMKANVSQPLTVADIARAVGQSPRSLQVAFRRHLDQTPMQYLHQIRMTAVRFDLAASDPSDGATVRGVALRWGFTHAARFAAQYREKYGENPSTTLRG